MWIYFLLFLLGISPNGFEGFEDEGILVELENFLQISAQNQQGEEILARQKRQNELELTAEIAGTSTNAPLAKSIEKPPNLEEGNEIGLELAEMGGQNSSNNGGNDEFAIGNEEDGDLLTMIWRSDWIWKEEMEGRLRGNGTELGGWKEGKNGTFFGGELANGTESTTERTMKTMETTAFWRKRIRKKGHFDLEAKNSTVWPLAWLNLPATNSPPPFPPIRHSSTNAFSFPFISIPFPSSTSPTTKIITNSSKTTPKANRQLCCPPGGLWANWTQIGQCDDNCGGCGQQIFQRECLSTAWGCPCTGESTVQRECAFAPCPFPRLSCCNGRRINSTGENRQANCGPPSVPPANSPSPPPDCLCCPSGGVWGEWKAVGECSDNCGSCGTQQFNRQCISLAWGCPCSGPVILKLVCNQRPCTFPRLSCCNRLKVKASANRTLICGPEVKMPTTEGGGGIHQLDCN